ncbi:hypothetical protein ACFQ0B_58525 [Nonomuraea thailandensis]
MQLERRHDPLGVGHDRLVEQRHQAADPLSELLDAGGLEVELGELGAEERAQRGEVVGGAVEDAADLLQGQAEAAQRRTR